MRYLYFRLTSDKNLIEAEITNGFGLKTDYFYTKGETRYIKGENITYKEYCWQHEKQLKENDNLELEILRYIQYLIDKKDIIVSYKKDVNIQLGVMLYLDDYQNTFVISKKMANLLNQLDIDFLVTIANVDYILEKMQM